MDAEGTKEYVAELITRQLQHESFQLQPEQVTWQPSIFCDVQS